MSKMKDIWGDTLEVVAEDGTVVVTFTEKHPYDGSVCASMELDADLARKFVKKLKKAIAEVEDM